jgi:HTH-type transcriptional regulator/antitoxin HigA
MELRILRTKKDHAQALAEVERLIALDPARGTPEGDALEVLSILVERYEKEHFSIDAPTPIEAIEFRMDQMGLRQADLVPYFGSRSRASEVLSGKRALTPRRARNPARGPGRGRDAKAQARQEADLGETQGCRHAEEGGAQEARVGLVCGW